jgi:hypothetical protein
MKNLFKGIAAASLMTLGTAGFAQADMMSMMQGMAACNTAYGQCMASADMMLASSPQEGVAKMQSNMSHAMSCGEQLRACYASAK